MTPRLRTLDAHPESNPGLSPGAYMAAHNPLQLQPQRIQYPLLASSGTVHISCTDIYASKTPIHIKNRRRRKEKKDNPKCLSQLHLCELWNLESFVYLLKSSFFPPPVCFVSVLLVPTIVDQSGLALEAPGKLS